MENGDQTTHYVRRAVEGELESVGWVVEHFSPLLLSQARFRIRRGLQGLYDPEDLVNEVWIIALPRLRDIEPRGDRFTPVLVSFLTRTLVLHYNTLLKRHIGGKPLHQSSGDGEDDLFGNLADDVTGIVTRTVKREASGALHECIEALPEKYREVLVLRGIEQNSNQEVAAALGIEANTVAVQFKRAKEMLREKLPADILEMMESLV